MKNKSKLVNQSFAIFMAVLTLGASILVLGFQNCSTNAKYLSSAKSSGNGDGYGGEIVRYYFYDAQNPCVQHDVTGSPLPNGAIFSSDQYRLVRKSCQDLTPVDLSASDVQVSSTGDLTYQSQSFQVVSSGASLELAQSGCPTGHTPLANGVRDNLMLDSQELLSANWYRHPGILPALEGSLLGVPLYSVTRNDPTQLDQWRRLSQFPDVAISQGYALSFLAQPSVSTVARVMVYQTNGIDLQVTVDLTSGSGTIISQGSMTGVEIQSSVVSGATRLVTVFFTPTVDPLNPDVGISPDAATLGASIVLSDVRLVATSNYCSP